MKKSITASVGCGVRGVVQCHVVDARTKEVLRTFPKQNNLILNRYLDMWAGRSFSFQGGWQAGFTYACAGDGLTPTQEDSGVVVAAQVGTTVTLTGVGFAFTNTATDSGKVIKWDSGEEAMIVSVTSPSVVEVNVTQAVSDDEFTVYLCNQTKMGGGIGAAPGTSDIKRTTTYLTGVGNCGTTWLSPHIVQMKRTFDFSAEAGPVTYNEIGMSESSVVDSATLNVRVLLAAPVALIAGQQLRVVYTLVVTFSPSTSQVVTADIPGWPVAPATDTNGVFGIEYLNIKTIETTGAAVNWGGVTLSGCEPGQVSEVYLSHITTAVLATPQQTLLNMFISGQTAVAAAYEAYVASSFTCVLSVVFTPSMANRTDLRSLFLGFYNYPAGNYYPSHMRVRFDQAQTKDNLHRLTSKWRWVASRVLS